MAINLNENPDWEIKINEISAGVYQISAIDRERRTIEFTGCDPEELFMKCKEAAINIKNNITP